MGEDDLKPYVSIKTIMARPKESQTGKSGYEVIYPDGYTSWCPKDVFEAAYMETTRPYAVTISHKGKK